MTKNPLSGHTEAVQGLALPNQTPNRLYSVSKDTTIKAWSLDTEDKLTISSTRWGVIFGNVICPADFWRNGWINSHPSLDAV